MKWARLNSVALVAILLFLFAEIALLFFTPRSETLQLLIVYFGMCGAYLILYHEVKNIQSAAYLGIFFRCIAWLAFPNLSNDIYRFIWDGAVILEGFNPFAQTPTEFLLRQNEAPFSAIYPLLNSPDYFSVYPLVIQIANVFGALAANDLYLAALLIKLPILLAEIGTIWILPKILLNLHVSPKYSVLYMLNPLLIIDVVGNAHFEAVMIFFVMLSVKWIQERKFNRAGIALAFAVGTTLLPLILLPFLYKALVGSERRGFLTGFGVAFIILFSPFLLTENFVHFAKSLNLYFQVFEFNASVYYVLKVIGTFSLGYNPVAVLGPLLGLCTIIVAIYLFKRQPPGKLSAALQSSLWVVFTFLMLSTTVHPWNISFLVILGVLSRRPFAVVWSVLVFMSYTAYHSSPAEEMLWLVALEYLLLLLAVLSPKFVRSLIVFPINRL